MLVTNNIFAANNVNSIEGGNKLIEKFVKPKTRKLFKNRKVSKFKKLSKLQKSKSKKLTKFKKTVKK